VAAPERRWGWHQLADRWAATLVADAQIAPGDLVIDVGAGTGAITRQLVDRGARVLAVELHPARAASLRQRFDPRCVTVITADASDLRLPRRPFHVVANPPFSVTTALLRRLTAPGSRLVRADLVVPWHVARRWAIGDAPGAHRWRREFHALEGRSLPRSAFAPPPPHSTAVLTIRRVSSSARPRRGVPGAPRRR
jgi:23S rRNA (adenine-N6)-dimethyltransferase